DRGEARQRHGRHDRAAGPTRLDQQRRAGRHLMAGTAVQLGATVICAHAGQATPTTPNPRVLLGNQPVITLSSPCVVAGCALTGTTLPPCVTAQFIVGTTRVLAGGVPVVVQTGTSLCVPTGTPLQVLVTQLRVTAT